MPAVNPNNASQQGTGPQRTSFRPPWVKEGPTPLPMPSAPWTARARESQPEQQPNKTDKPAPRKLSKVTIIPSQPNENNTPDFISQANLKWNPKALPIEKKQGSLTPKIQSVLTTDKEVFSQAILKPATPKHKKEKLDTNVVSEAQFTAKRPSAFIQHKENTGQQTGSEGREGQRRESTTTIPIAVESKRKESTDRTVPIKVESRRKESTDTAPQGRRKESVVQIKKEPVTETPKPTLKPVEQPKSILKEPSKSSVPSVPKPPPPPAPPMAPPIPPPPPPQKPIIETVMTPQKAVKLDALRSRPRRRPDWTDMMKEVESGIKLRHIQCNDRSAPILPQAKAKGQFVYESEKENKRDPHKQLLNQIAQGVKLKRVKCNDRSKPVLDGLRKFRRQMTIEEQIQKSMSMADVVAVAAEPDELDDIDKVRDDLQSTKQMLALELRNKEALERETKRLMARLLNLEVELEKEKNSKQIATEKGTVVHARSEADEKLVQQLKEEASDAHRVVKEMEDKYKYTAEELDSTRAKLEKAWLKNQQLEMELKTGARGNMPIAKQPSAKKLAASSTNVPNGKGAPVESEEESEYTETETETESEEEENESNAAALQEKRIARELKLLATKLRSYKEKQASALRERHSLREQLRKQQKTLKDEKKKYKALQKEVDKMAKLMKDDEEEEEEEEEKPEDEVEEEEEETESESESEESEEEDLTDGDLPEDASVDDRRKNLTDRSKHHETRLGTLKKGNYLLKANIDRLQDDINRQREMSLALQEDLNSVLAELG